MKKILKYLMITAALAFTLTGCNKFLDTQPIDTLTPNAYYNTEEQLNTALIGVYDIIGQESVYGSAIFVGLGACTDEGWYARSALTTGMQVYNLDYSNGDVRNFWRSLYSGIERANLLIENINKPTMDSVRRSNILGQALFLRGYCHFLLVSNFGDVPLRITATSSVNNTSIPRTPTAAVYSQILKDMQEAETRVQTITAIGSSSRISKTTVQGILARVCLYMAGYPLQDRSKYAEALAWAKKVQASGEHALRTTFDATLTTNAYSQIFINHARNVYDTKECMWEADFFGNFTDSYREAGRIGNGNGIAFSGSNSAEVGFSYGFINVTGKLYNLYQAADTRRDWAIAPYYYNGNTLVNWPATASVYSRNCGKWRRSFELPVSGGKNQNYTPQNFPILRYADVLLMLAEAENEVNGPTALAVSAINQIRERAGATTVTATSKDALSQIIRDERARELCFEGLRRPDLIRWGIFIPTMKALGVQFAADNSNNTLSYGVLGYNNVSDRNLLFPIPAAEISVNQAMTQNPGW
jgi:hypothetical protein